MTWSYLDKARSQSSPVGISGEDWERAGCKLVFGQDRFC